MEVKITLTPEWVAQGYIETCDDVGAGEEIG